MEIVIRKDKDGTDVQLEPWKNFDYKDPTAAKAKILKYLNSLNYFEPFKEDDSFQKFLGDIADNISGSIEYFDKNRKSGNTSIYIEYGSIADTEEDIEAIRRYYDGRLENGCLYYCSEHEHTSDFDDILIWEAPEKYFELLSKDTEEDEEMVDAFYDEIVRCNECVNNYYDIAEHIMETNDLRNQIRREGWLDMNWYASMEAAVERFFTDEGRYLPQAADDIIIEFVKMLRDIKRQENGQRTLY